MGRFGLHLGLVAAWQAGLFGGGIPSAFSAGGAATNGVVVEVLANEGRGCAMRVDHAFFEVKGVGGSDGLALAAGAGANSFRTWGMDDLERRIEGKKLLDHAHDHGLRATVGLWVAHERHGFCYQDQKQVLAQREQILATVRAHKNHPAVLMWGLGNEMEGLSYTSANAYVWKELNTLAELIKAEDPYHPVMTVVALPLEEKLRDMQAWYPALDILGINAYGGAVTIPASLAKAGWTRPIILAEFGPHGQWEVPKTAWGAPLEPTSTEKAAFYLQSYDAVRTGAPGLFLGSYAFLWGNKHEATSTWYGMFLPTGEKLAAVDVMIEVWSGAKPGNRCPAVAPIEWGAARGPVPAGSVHTAAIAALDPERDALDYEWVVMAENAEYKEGGDREEVPPALPELILETHPGRVAFKAPAVPGAYRLYAYVRDGKGGAATANIPFFVEAR